MDFYPKKVIYNFREPFFLAEIFEKASFDPYNFRITRLSARKSEHTFNNAMFIIISGFKLHVYSLWVPPEDAFVVFLHFLLKVKPFDEFFSFQNVMANLCVCVATRMCVYLCVCEHPLNRDVSQATTALFSVPFSFDGRIGRFLGFPSLFVEV